MTTTDANPAAHGAPAARFVGQSVKRLEDPRLLTGHGRYVDDITLPGQLYMAFLRSDVASGVVRSIDATAARNLEGVQAVFTGADLNPNAGPLWTSIMGPDAKGPPLLPLAHEDVRFVGDPVAIVVATSRYVAEDALELIEVDIESRPVVATFEDARADGAPVVHPELGPNVIEEPWPVNEEVDRIMAEAPHVVTETFAMTRMTNVPMETRGMVASWSPFAEELEVWPATQSPHEIKSFASRLLGLAEHRIRVYMGDVGGGFGQKMFPTREEACVLLVAKALGRPVKWIEDRRENLIAANQARHEVTTLSMAVDDDGRILAATCDLTDGVGSFPPGGGPGGGGGLVAMLFTGPYKIPQTGFKCRLFFSNTCGKAAFRGPWAVETIAREQMIDAVARQLGMDPIEVRRRNIVHQEDLPFTLASGLVFDIVTPSENLEQAAEMLDWEAFRAEQASAKEEGRYLGVGLSVCVEPSAVGMGPLGTDRATIRIDSSGTVEVAMGTGSHGQSLETTIPQVVAEYLGCAIEDVVLRQGADTPYGAGTGGSRSAVIAGGAAQTAAVSLRDKVVRIAAEMLEAAPEDLEVVDSIISVRGTPSAAVSLGAVAASVYLNPASVPQGIDPSLEVSASYTPPSTFTWSNACHLCVCEVDRDTGVVAVRRYLVSEDCGVMINPMVVEGQIAGGVVQGIGGALFENMAYDGEGNPLATTFLDYLIPTATDVPDMQYGHIETRSNTLGGHKGMGEGGAIAAPAAVANAVNDALRQMGAPPVTQFPITPVRVLEAIAQAG